MTRGRAPRSSGSAFYERLAEIAREHDVLVCSDEAYTELWYDEPPVSALQVADRSNLVVFNTLSKRSSMTGYRCGFVAASEGVIESLRKFRPNVGTAPQVFVQRAGIVAWSDEAHVERNRALYARKRQLLLDVFQRKHLMLAGSMATMYLWVGVPDGDTSESFADRLLEHGIVVAPGSYFGRAGEGYVRFALVPTEQECADAAALLEEVL
jgi:aspartate/methionine/tyrosine aminotransferase